MKAFLILLSMVVIFFALLFKRNADISPINTTRDDILFKYFPSHSTRLLKSGTKVPDYFQAYAADLLIIHGFSDLEVATKKVRGQLYPVEFQGKAYSELWVQNFRDTNIGPFKELLNIYIASDTIQGASDHGCDNFFCLAFLPLKPGYYWEIADAWIDEDTALAYKRELLGYDATKTVSFDMQVDGANWNFEIKDSHKKPLLSGNLSLSTYPVYQLSNLYSFLFKMDYFFNVLLLMLHPPLYHPLTIVSTIPTDGIEVPVLQAYGRFTPFFQKPSAGENLKLEGELASLKFEPEIHEYATHLKLVTGRPVRDIA